MSVVRISVSRSQETTDPWRHNAFNAAEGPFLNLQKVIVSRVWSPVVWKDGTRSAQNFLQAQIIALDFDNGEWTLQTAQEFCHDYSLAHIIGVTKSHGKEKISPTGVAQPACDRFRLVLLAEDPCTSADDYKTTMAFFMRMMPCDKACKDGARYFFPCTKIVDADDGKRIPWQSCPPEKTGAAYYAKTKDRAKDSQRQIPEYLDQLIRRGINKELEPQRSRHEAVYQIGGELFVRGFTCSEILKYMAAVDSPLLEYVGYVEAERSIQGGIRKRVQDRELYG